MDCQYGVHYKQPKQPDQSKRIYLQGTRKKGCLAHVEICEFVLHPECSIESLSLTELSMKQTRKLKEKKLKALKLCLQKNSHVKIVKKYFVSLPAEDANHSCHPTRGIMGISQQIHPELINKIQELVGAGTTKAIEIKKIT